MSIEADPPTTEANSPSQRNIGLTLSAAAALALAVGAFIVYTDPIAEYANRYAYGAAEGWVGLAFGHIVGTLFALATLATGRRTTASHLGLTSALLFGFGGLLFFVWLVIQEGFILLYADLFAPGFALFWGFLIARRAFGASATKNDRMLIGAGAVIWLAAQGYLVFVVGTIWLDPFIFFDKPEGVDWPVIMVVGKNVALVAAAALLWFPAQERRLMLPAAIARTVSIALTLAVLLIVPVELAFFSIVDGEPPFLNGWTVGAFDAAIVCLAVLGLWLPTFTRAAWARSRRVHNGLTIALVVLAILAAGAWSNDSFAQPLTVWHLGMGLTWAAIHHVLSTIPISAPTRPAAGLVPADMVDAHSSRWVAGSSPRDALTPKKVDNQEGNPP